jgi:hypothetical protein
MSDMAKHSQPATGSRRDHLWVLVIIAGFALFDVWEAWSEVGNKSGFAHGTGWTLTVIVEAFAGYCLFAWFDAPGPRSRRFAMWSAITALALSMIGQGASVLAAHTMPPLWLMVFVRILPVIVLALIAVLVHLRRLDREDGEREQAALERAEADERAALRAEVTALRAELETARGDAETASATAEALTRKLAAATGSGTRKRAPGNAARKPAGNGTRKQPAATAPAPPETPALDEADLPGNWDELDTETKVLFLVNEKGYSGSAAGVGAGVTDARGRQIVRIAKGLTGTAPQDIVDGERNG